MADLEFERKKELALKADRDEKFFFDQKKAAALRSEGTDQYISEAADTFPYQLAPYAKGAALGFEDNIGAAVKTGYDNLFGDDTTTYDSNLAEVRAKEKAYADTIS